MTETPTTLYDKNNRPIYAGDLLRSFHFTGARRRRLYLYHVAVTVDGGLDAVPACHLEPSKIRGGGRCRIDEKMATNFEIIQGINMLPATEEASRLTQSYYERPKRKSNENGISNHSGSSRRHSS